MTRMTSRVVDDDGRPEPGVYVHASLQATSRWLAGHTGLVEGRESTYTDGDGRWVLDLEHDLEDPNAWWRVRVFERGTFELNVPNPPVGGGLVDISAPGVIRDPTLPPIPPPDPSLPYNTALVYIRDEVTGFFRLVPQESAGRWGGEVRFTSTEPPIGEAPEGATWVDYDNGVIYKAIGD